MGALSELKRNEYCVSKGRAMSISGHIRVAGYSVLLNLAVSITKGILAFISGSTALIADTVHGLADLVESIAVLIGLRLSSLQLPEFPLGLYKVENFVALLCSGAIFFTTYELVRMSLIYGGSYQLHSVPLSLSVLIMIQAVIFAFMRYEGKKAEELNSPALRADAGHWQTDIVSTLVVLGGITGTWMGYRYFDRIAAGAIVLIIVKTGWTIFKDSVKSLLDASVDRPKLDKIRDAISRYPEVRDIRSIIARNSGSFIFCQVELSLAVKSLKKAHGVSEHIESSIRAAVPHIDRVIIHYEPTDERRLRYAVALENREGKISLHFGSAPYFVVITDERGVGGHLAQEVIKNPFAAQEKRKGIHLAEFLISKGVDVVICRESLEGKGPELVFKQADVEFRRTDKEKLEQVTADLTSAD
jgi:cation diffusion facilitator family transporter